MRVLILHQFFYPDHSAVSQLMTELAESLVERGVDVTALAGRGRYNGGEKLSKREVHRGVRIERAWATSYGKGSLVGRLADYFTFYLGATWKLLRVPRHDILLALSHPPLIGLIALAIGRMRGMRVVALVQDIHPDLAIALGTISPRNPAARLLGWLNRISLRGADRIVVLADCMREKICEQVGATHAARIDTIHNWADGQLIKPLNGETNPFINEHNLEGKFVVLFSGNFGHVNDFKTVMEAARRLSNRTEIVFLFVGDGVKAGEIKSFANRNELRNIRVLPYQPRESLRFSLAAGDVLLTTLAEGLAGLSVPSKAYGIMAAGRPLLFVGDARSGVARLVAENSCGAVIPANCDERLAEVIAEWVANPEKLNEMGAAARKLFESRFDRTHAVEAYLGTFEKCMKEAPVHESGAFISDPEG